MSIGSEEFSKGTVQVFLFRACIEVTDLVTMSRSISMKDVRKLLRSRRLPEASCLGSN